MICNTDQDILNSDFIQWSNTMEAAFESQLRYLAESFEWQIENTRMRTKNGIMSLDWPLPTALRYTFQDPVHKNLVPVTCFIYIILKANTEKNIKKEAHKAMSELMSRVGNTEFEYSAYKPVYRNDI